MKALRRQRMTCLSGMLNLFAHCELLKTTVNYSTCSTLPRGGKLARKQNVHLKCEQIRVMFVLCRRMSLRASFDKVLRSARTYFCDQIAIINGIDLYVEAKPCLGSVERGSWGLSGEVGTPPRPPPPWKIWPAGRPNIEDLLPGRWLVRGFSGHLLQEL